MEDPSTQNIRGKADPRKELSSLLVEMLGGRIESSVGRVSPVLALQNHGYMIIHRRTFGLGLNMLTLLDYARRFCDFVAHDMRK